MHIFCNLKGAGILKTKQRGQWSTCDFIKLYMKTELLALKPIMKIQQKYRPLPVTGEGAKSRPPRVLWFINIYWFIINLLLYIWVLASTLAPSGNKSLRGKRRSCFHLVKKVSRSKDDPLDTYKKPPKCT